MADTTYVDYVAPAVNAEWLNEINDHVWHDTPITGTTVHAADKISNVPAGTIEATTVQEAIDEIVSDLSAESGSNSVGFIQAGAGAVARTVQDKLRDEINVVDFDASGVGDETAEMQAALTAAAGKTLVFTPGVEYTISSTLTVPENTTIMGYGAVLKNTSTHITMLSLSSGCNVFGLELIGAGSTYDSSGRAIRAAGTRNGAGVAPTYLTGIHIEDCIITDFGSHAVDFEYVQDSFVIHNTIKRIGYSGVFCYSCDAILVEGNHIEELTGETTSGELNAYGVTFTSLVNTSDFVRDPQSQYCRAIGNLIKNIPTWHGLDTHGGTRCDFIGNRIQNCRRGVILTNLTTIGATICTVSNNTIVNTLTGTNSNGSQKQGAAIWDIGASASIRNFFNVIRGNSIYQHGSPTEALSCIHIANAGDGTVCDNVLRESFTAGIGIYSDVLRYAIHKNTIVNPKGPGVAGGGSTDFPSGILFSGSNFTSINVTGNTVIRNDATVATKVGEMGILVANTASKTISLSNNTLVGTIVGWYIPEATGMSGEFEGEYTGTLTGCTTSPTGTIRYSVANGVVTLSINSAITGTSNTTALTITGMPTFIAPGGNRYVICRVTDDGVAYFGVAIVASTGVISLFKNAIVSALTASGTKGTPQQTISYLI